MQKEQIRCEYNVQKKQSNIDKMSREVRIVKSKISEKNNLATKTIQNEKKIVKITPLTNPPLICYTLPITS